MNLWRVSEPLEMPLKIFNNFCGREEYVLFS